MALIALRTASIITPTSAKIASHIFTIPNTPSIRHIPLIPNANIIFFPYDSQTFAGYPDSLTYFYRIVILISTTSAASIAASSTAIAPMAIPMSARDRTGASFIPSPTNATLLSSFAYLSIFSS